MGEIALLATATHERADYSSTAAVLALALDQRGQRVLVLDLLPAVHAAHVTLGLPGEAKGLEWVLFGNAVYNEMLARTKDRPNLHVLTYQGGARSRLPVEPLKRLCQQVARTYDVVLVACAIDQGPWVTELEEAARADVLLVPGDQQQAFAVAALLPSGDQARHILVTEARPGAAQGDPDHPEAIASIVGGSLLGALPSAPEGHPDPAPADAVAEVLLTQVLRLPARRERQATTEATAPPPGFASATPALSPPPALSPAPAPTLPFPPAPLLVDRPHVPPPPSDLRLLTVQAAAPSPGLPRPTFDASEQPPGELNQVLDEVKMVWKLKRNLTEGRAQLEMAEAEYAAGAGRLQSLLQLEDGEPVGRDEIANLARRLGDLKSTILRLRQDLPRMEQEYRSLFLNLKDTLAY